MVKASERAFLKKMMANHVRVTPIEQYIQTNGSKELLCGICYDGNTAEIRPCCKRVYCNHCYAKFKKCPNPECKEVTRQEKKTGKVFAITVQTEIDECRICLDPGLKRRCCGNYYCDDCYYNRPKCRSCGTKVDNHTIKIPISRAMMCSIAIGWLLTAFVCLSIAGIIILANVNNSVTPKGVYGNKCFGLFRGCPLKFCADMSASVMLGESPLPNLATWEHCALGSQYKLESFGCIFDTQMYRASNGHIGYEICSAGFNDGVYVFEDDFEHWSNSTFNSNKMKSALWSEIVNAEPTSHCGVPKNLGGKKALTFSGALNRHAITLPLDVSSGGRFQAELFMAPLGYDISHPYCKTTYSSFVSIDFSVDDGITWQNMKYYNAYDYRQEEFFYVDVELPQGAYSNATRFRFYQGVFNGDFDNWAVDNVKILKYLPSNWHSSMNFQTILQETDKEMKFAQCCYDSDWCDVRLTESEMKKCHQYSWYKQRSNDYKFRLSEKLVIAALLINLLKFFYISAQDWYMRRRFPFQDELKEILLLDHIVKYIPIEYRPNVRDNDTIDNIHQAARNVEKEEEKTVSVSVKKNNKNCVERIITCFSTPKDDTNDSTEEQKEDKDKNEKKRATINTTKTALEIRRDNSISQYFMIYAFTLWSVFTVYLMATTENVLVHQPMYPYRLPPNMITTTAGAVILFAIIIDFKEIYHTIRYIIPCRDRWVPLVTIDQGQDIQSLFIGKFQVLLKDVVEIVPFTKQFLLFCYLSYFVSCFPWCLFMLIIRNNLLVYSSMRVFVSVIGSFVILRAVLGPAVVLKGIFMIQAIFDFDYMRRAKLGQAIHQNRTIIGAVLGALGISFFFTFVAAISYNSYTWYVFIMSFFLGTLYGFINGVYHSMHLRPWMIITKLDSGNYLKLKKKEQCKFRRGKKWCTDLHSTEELFFMLPINDIEYVNIVKNVMGSES